MISVLIPTDFSKNAFNALRRAMSMISKEEIHLILLNSYQILPSSTEMFISIEDILQKNSEKGLLNEIKGIQKEFPKKKFTYDLISKYGNLKYGIHCVVKEYHVDIIIMGTNGATGLQKLFIGSNASEIMKNIGKPVLILPEGVTEHKFDNIVLAIDYKEKIDSSVLESLRLMARLNGSHINIVSIVPPGKLTDVHLNSNKDEICNELKDFSHSYDLIEGDDVVEAINNFIISKDANMLAVIPHKWGIFESLFHKSISKELVLRADIPMMAMH